eukprot:1462961-Rhodomonas_salina.3
MAQQPHRQIGLQTWAARGRRTWCTARHVSTGLRTAAYATPVPGTAQRADSSIRYGGSGNGVGGA